MHGEAPRPLEISMPLLTTYRSYPQLFLCSILLLILGFLGAGLYLHNTYYNQQEQINNYGKTLARSAARQAVDADRKSTRLNSSHVKISYAVFCLKKKKRKK